MRHGLRWDYDTPGVHSIWRVQERKPGRSMIEREGCAILRIEEARKHDRREARKQDNRVRRHRFNVV